MKRKLAFVFSLLILFSCNEDLLTSSEELEVAKTNENYSDLDNSRARKKFIDADITINPSGDQTGSSDADAIETALNSIPAGGTILLESGKFYLSREIFVPGNSGTLIGRGKSETEIIGVGNEGTPFIGNFFFAFINPSGPLTISNLSLSLPEGFVTFNDNLFGFIITVLNEEGSDTHFDELILKGTDAAPNLDPIFGSQPNNSIIVRGNFNSFPLFTSGGNHTVSNSEFSEVAFQATIFEGFKDANIEIYNNSFTEIKQTIYRFMSGSTVSITDNTLQTNSFGGIVITQEGNFIAGEPNNVVIRGNTVRTSGFMPIEIGWVPEGSANFSLLIEKNKLTNEGSDPFNIYSNFSGIAIFNGNNDAIVRNNILRGGAEFGIIQESNSGTFSGNNLQGFSPLITDYGFFGNSNTIIGNGNSSVLDLGIDNITTGMTKVDGVSIGERMKEALAKRKEILDAINK
ncbi:right-handed parallel beta-helix repeat-containing protein [Algoriphagus sp.]|uniref:right-handed parallel beta-helix repeat-containing protein n=1 Tax=Algoriphagus sp. TaxID=1872435 RepID=UPI0025DB19D4|nr:right-handed parallel beta-helix repeat-containing protein [Algoriphagus sp.]